MIRLAPHLAALAASMAIAGPALAQGAPEQLDQLEPGAGEWQAEYHGTFGGDGGQSAEILIGLSDRFAVGVEAEFEGPRGGLIWEGTGLIALFRATDPDTQPVGVGLLAEAEIGRDGHFAGAGVRAIAERRRGGWWGQSALILRHARDDGARGTGIAYAASLQREVGPEIWFGAEASGQIKRLSGDAELAPEGNHYLGPSLTVEREAGETEIEFGIAWLQRVRGHGAGSGPRIFVQFGF